MRFAHLSIIIAMLALADAADAQRDTAMRASTVRRDSVAAATAQAKAGAATRPLPKGVEFIVRTVPLHHLTSTEAMKLLQPYVQTDGGGVYEVSPNIRAVTIREVPRVNAEMMRVLGQYDREPGTVTLNFQLIAAENTGTRDPGVAGLDSLLRGVLKYSGYRLLNTSIATASEDGHVSQTLSGDGDSFSLSVQVTDLRIEGNDASVHLDVVLYGAMVPKSNVFNRPILTTGVTVPLGQTVVLGTSAADASQRALILTVRPQLASAKR